MPSHTHPDPRSIYDWLSCPDCGSRDVIRGPRFDDNTVELRCEDCDLSSRVGL